MSKSLILAALVLTASCAGMKDLQDLKDKANSMKEQAGNLKSLKDKKGLQNAMKGKAKDKSKDSQDSLKGHSDDDAAAAE